jgi:hypothetical protein
MLQEEHFQDKRLSPFSFGLSFNYLGFNCALGADLLKPYLQTLAQNTSSMFQRILMQDAKRIGEYDETPK